MSIEPFKTWVDSMPYVRIISRLLANDMSWIVRRVENLYVLDTVGDRRKVSLDIDMNQLRDIAEMAEWKQTTIPVPLGWMKKGLSLDFSVSLDDHPLSVWSRPDDSRIGLAAILSTFTLEDPTRLKPSINLMNGLYDLCYRMPSDKDWLALRRGFKTLPPLWDEIPATKTSEFDYFMLADDISLRRALLLTLNYMPIISIPEDIDTTLGKQPIVKFDILTGPEPNDVRRRLPHIDLTSSLEIRISSDMEAQREHLHVHLPDSFEITENPLVVVDSDASSNDIDEIMEDAFGLVNSHSAAIYRTGKNGSRDYSISLAFQPNLDNYLPKVIAGFAGSILLFIALLIGLSLSSPDHSTHTYATVASYLIATLQIVVAGASAYAATNNGGLIREFKVLPIVWATRIGIILNLSVAIATIPVMFRTQIVVVLSKSTYNILKAVLYGWFTSLVSHDYSVMFGAIAINCLVILWLGLCNGSISHYRKKLSDIIGSTSALKYVVREVKKKSV